MSAATANELHGASIPASSPFPFGDADWFRDLAKTEATCRAYLEELRWPSGVSCPECGCAKVWRLRAKKRFQCSSCRRYFSTTSGTVFHNSHLPLWKWFLTIYLMIDYVDGVPANQLAPLLGVTYKTAWFVEHRVRFALDGGKPNGHGPPHARDRLFDRSLTGCYRQLSLKHLRAYAAEREWRQRTRENPNAFRDTTLALIHSEPLSYAELIRRR
jgi:transposase-like protein